MPTLNIKNFFKKNTPKFVQIVGDIGLLAAFLSTNILVFKQELIDIGLTSIDHNIIFDKINSICLVVGVIVKFISKFFGVKTVPIERIDEPNP
jgi:hypothetical protein